MLKDAVASLIDRAVAAISKVYGDRLVSIVLYGSVGRGTMRQDSDIDLLIVAHDLPRGRMNRVKEFEVVEAAIAGDLEQACCVGGCTELFPILKTPEEVVAGSPAVSGHGGGCTDPVRPRWVFAQRLARLRGRLTQLGVKRLWQGNTWYWDLKPDFRPGEVFEL